MICVFFLFFVPKTRHGVESFLVGEKKNKHDPYTAIYIHLRKARIRMTAREVRIAPRNNGTFHWQAA